MKLSLTFGLLSAAFAVHQDNDIYFHSKQVLGPSMWTFSADGLTIYSPDSSVLKAHPKAEICPVTTSLDRTGALTTNDDCGFFTYASDGHRYVWAGTFAGTHRVEAFDIDTGDLVGHVPTCSTPLDLEYHSGRREMYLRCAQSDAENAGEVGEIDVFSVDALSAQHQLFHLNDTARPYGRLAIHSSMGEYGYVAALDQPYLTQLDLSTQTIADKIPLPDTHGAYDMTYSPVNRHVFVRTRVCCSCGFAGADQRECGRGPGTPGVEILTGPSKGRTDVNGTCSSGCEGSLADTIGVYEFNTVTKEVVTSHNIDPEFGFGADPVSSPDGKYILLLGNDGGKAVRVITPNANGQASSVATDIEVNFEGGRPGAVAISDFAFLQDERRNFLVLGAGTDNDVVLVDLDDNFRMKKLSLTESAESTGGTSRNIEWAIGTDFVWVNGGDASEMYILEFPSSNINDARVVKKLSDVPNGQMIMVNNFERQRMMELIAESSAKSASLLIRNDGKMLAIVALIVGAAGIVMMTFTLMKINAVTAQMPTCTHMTKSVKHGSETSNEEMESKSLGSNFVL